MSRRLRFGFLFAVVLSIPLTIIACRSCTRDTMGTGSVGCDNVLDLAIGAALPAELLDDPRLIHRGTRRFEADWLGWGPYPSGLRDGQAFTVLHFEAEGLTVTVFIDEERDVVHEVLQYPIGTVF